MSATPAQIVPPTLLLSNVSKVFTATKLTRIDRMTATNPTGSSVNVFVYVVPSGATAGVANIITPQTAVAANTVKLLNEEVWHVLNIGDSIYTVASTANVLVFMVSGTVFD